MATTYEPITTYTVTTAQSSYTFSSISSAYTDLYLVTNAKHTADSNSIIQFNGDTGTNYSYTYLYGSGSTATSARASTTASPIVDYYALDGQGSTNISIMNYSNTTTYKTAISRGSESVNGTMAVVVLWRSTAAITSILIKTSTGNFAAGSTFTLYGIKAA